ncbi:cupin [Priestia sp. OVS21]|nr:cupin [Priestia sp. OVS21]
MEIYKFSKEHGEKVEKYQSHLATYVKMIHTNEAATIGYMYIEEEGTVGYHEAPIPQLFIVVEGEGWVTGENRKQYPLDVEKQHCGEKENGIRREVKPA